VIEIYVFVIVYSTYLDTGLPSPVLIVKLILTRVVLLTSKIEDTSTENSWLLVIAGRTIGVFIQVSPALFFNL